jgi:UDP-N-acetylglucosamine diphosphorylase/glucosamine-1-phosphate N-acetyltransferase
MHIILSDFDETSRFYPLTLSRPIAELRFGITTLKEKWSDSLKEGVFSYDTTEHLTPYFSKAPENSAAIVINAAIVPSVELTHCILQLKEGQQLMWQKICLAYVRPENFDGDHSRFEVVAFEGELIHLNHITDLFSKLDKVLIRDFDEVAFGAFTELHPTCTVIGKHPVYLSKGASAFATIFNTEDGPIYIGAGAKVMEGSILRGPLAIGDFSTVKMGSKIYGATSIGPHCKVGGELNNVSMLAYSNKGHEGFLGNSILGQWCNLGADTNTSNLKNDYGEVKLYDYSAGRFKATGLQFCGLVMGDHSKAGINTMFNTGTVVGFNANIFGAGYPRNFIPSFTWGGPQGMSDYRLDKAMETAERVLERRSIAFDDREKGLFAAVHELTTKAGF